MRRRDVIWTVLIVTILTLAVQGFAQRKTGLWLTSSIAVQWPMGICPEYGRAR